MNQPPDEIREFQAPRLRIIHLLAWMTLSAVFFSLPGWCDLRFGDGPEMLRNPAAIVALMLYLVVAPTFAGDFLGIRLVWKYEGLSRESRLQPGHFLLGVGGMAGVFYVCIFLAVACSRRPWLYPLDIILNVTAILGIPLTILGTVIVCSWAGSRVPQRRWKVFFYSTAYGWLSPLLLTFFCMAFPPLHRIPSAIFAICAYLAWPVTILSTLLLAVALDRAEWLNRDWLHWFGVASTAAVLGLFLVLGGLAAVS